MEVSFVKPAAIGFPSGLLFLLWVVRSRFCLLRFGETVSGAKLARSRTDPSRRNMEK